MLAPVIFMLIYILAPIIFLPVTLLSIAAGVLFGPVIGTIYSLIGATIGSTLSFLISRYLLKDWVDKKSHQKVIMFQDLIKKEHWKFIVLLRISPFLPFNIQNYILGLTDISMKSFFIATFFSLFREFLPIHILVMQVKPP